MKTFPDVENREQTNGSQMAFTVLCEDSIMASDLMASVARQHISRVFVPVAGWVVFSQQTNRSRVRAESSWDHLLLAILAWLCLFRIWYFRYQLFEELKPFEESVIQIKTIVELKQHPCYRLRDWGHKSRAPLALQSRTPLTLLEESLTRGQGPLL